VSDERVETSAIERVPRTPAEREALLREQPEGWEFLLFGAWLYEKQRELEPRWEAARTFDFPAAGQEPSVADDPVAAAQSVQAAGVAANWVTDALRRASDIVSQVSQTMTSERSEQAFGKPGESGDAAEIERFADDVMKIYRELLDWLDDLDAQRPPASVQGVYRAAREFALQPLEQFRSYVADLVRNFDDLSAALREGRAVGGTFKLTLELSDEATERFNREMQQSLAEVQHEADEIAKHAEEAEREAEELTRRVEEFAASNQPTGVATSPAPPAATPSGTDSDEHHGLMGKWRARGERREAERAQHQFEGELANWQAQHDALAEQLNLAEHFSGDTNSNQLVLQRGEALFASVAGAALVEDRSTGGHWEGRSSGVSFPVASIGGRSIRYRTGGTRGHYVQGTPVPTAIDVGTFFITDKRAIFQGQKQTRECRYDKLVGVQHDPNGATVFNVSNRQKATVISYGPDLTGWVAFRLGLALAHYQGNVPAIVEQLRGELAELNRGRPTQ